MSELQARGDGEGTIPRAPDHYGGAESLLGTPNVCWGRRKFLIQYISFRKTSRSNMGAPNLLFAPGAV